ncbi:probable lipid phosphate phosphatase beta [Magnolia sinica]|uniref:probable lipid phosphate phosphatase beta n=1 Tax=Magnolia sinica TaxID=86752 RepID=UPI002659C554|nr:probable lipid phosphate phosphatase beta [Magnolia sinica]
MEEPSPADRLATSPTTKPTSLLRRLIDLDTTWSLHIHTICQPFPRFLLKALEISGDGRFCCPIPIALFLSPPSSNSSSLRQILILLFLGFLLDLIAVGSIKYLIRRPRPVYNKGMHLTVAVDHWSFPSGHSSRVCFIASFLYLSLASLTEAFSQVESSGNGFLSHWIGPDGKAVERSVFGVCLWSAVTSMSRVLLGRHFLFDVIAGACLGLLEALFVLYVIKPWI